MSSCLLLPPSFLKGLQKFHNVCATWWLHELGGFPRLEIGAFDPERYRSSSSFWRAVAAPEVHSWVAQILSLLDFAPNVPLPRLLVRRAGLMLKNYLLKFLLSRVVGSLWRRVSVLPCALLLLLLLQTLARLCMKQLGLREAPFMVGFSPAAVRHIRNKPGEVIQGREVSFSVSFRVGISSLATPPRKQRLCCLTANSPGFFCVTWSRPYLCPSRS